MKKRMMMILLVSALAFTPVLGITVSAGAEDATEQTLEKKDAEVKSENASGQNAEKEGIRTDISENKTEEKPAEEEKNDKTETDKNNDKSSADNSKTMQDDSKDDKAVTGNDGEKKETGSSNTIEDKEEKTFEEDTDKNTEDNSTDKKADSDGDTEETEKTETGTDENNMDQTAGSDGSVTDNSDAEAGNIAKNDGDIQQAEAKKGKFEWTEEEDEAHEENIKKTAPVWDDIPHTAIEYNTWDKYTDSLGAVYSDKDKANFDIYSEMPAHLGEAGGEFTSGVSVKLNDDWNTTFYPRFVSVDSNGKVNWDPELKNLKKGTYKLYVCSTDAWHTSDNIDDLNRMDQIYGEAFMTIGEGRNNGETRDTMRWDLDLNKVAKKFGMSGDEVREISAQYSRLGQQWVTCAGTPTGSDGLLLLMAAVSGVAPVFAGRKRNA